MSVNPTSIQSGFARSRSEALFPRLFPDVGWWCPSLQSPGGTRLHDLSGRQNWGTLTNMATDDWIVSGGRGALDFDGSNDYVSIPTVGFPTIEGEKTVSLWTQYDGTNGRRIIFSLVKNDTGTANNSWDIEVSGFNATIVRWGGSAVSSLLLGSGNIWFHVVGRTDAAGNEQIFLNAVAGTSGTSADVGSVGVCRIGSFNSAFPSPYHNRPVDDVRMFSRALSSIEIRQLYQLGRGNMPRIRQRRYSVEEAGFKAYWANRRSRIIGAGI